MRTATEQYGALATLSAFVRAWSHQWIPSGVWVQWDENDALHAWEATLVLCLYNDINILICTTYIRASSFWIRLCKCAPSENLCPHAQSSEFAIGSSLLTLPLLAYRLLDVTTRGTLDNTWHMRTAKEQYGALTTLSAFVRAWSHQWSPLGFECSGT